MQYIVRHLNKLRWVVLTTIFSMLILLPYLHLYQHYDASHSYDLLTPQQKLIYDSMESVSAPFVSDPELDLDALKGTTWSGTLFGLKLSDPLAVVGQVSASRMVYWPFLLTALLPILLSIVFGRFFCGWICPATFIYELNDNLATMMRKMGLRAYNIKLNRRIKYFILAAGVVISATTGMVVFASFYPPAVIGREIYYGVALTGFGYGMVFFILTLFLDLMVTRRGFCRYLCPGGALYSLLGRYRLVRIKRNVTKCNDCSRCNVACQFGLDPLHDNFSQECNNCTACISVCPTNALSFSIAITDVKFQGPGELGHAYRGMNIVNDKDQECLRLDRKNQKDAA